MLRSRPICQALKYDIAIIGGGPIGSSIAYHCAKKQLGSHVDVVQSERGHDIKAMYTIVICVKEYRALS